jgi:hypothetical protein
VVPALLAAARWLRPRAAAAARQAAALARIMTRWAHGQRRPLSALAARASWWTGLWLLLVSAQDVITGADRGGLAGLPEALVGLGATMVVLVLASERRLRLAGLALGLAQGAVAIVAWIALYG